MKSTEKRHPLLRVCDDQPTCARARRACPARLRSRLLLIAESAIIPPVKKSHRNTLEAIFARPVRGGIRWADIEALFQELGAEVTEREGSRIGVYLFGEIRVFHRPHPSPSTDKGAVASIRKWLEANGVEP